MRSALGLLALAVASSMPAAPAAVGAFEGEWIGALLGSNGSLFLRVRIGGEGASVAGRVDIPVRGELGILLHHVEARGRRLTFEIPGHSGNLRVEGELTDDGRIAGTVAQREVRVRIELVRLHAGLYRAVSGAPGEAPGVTGFVPEYFEIRTTWLRERLDERRPVAGVAPEDAGAAETARGAAGTDPTRSGADSLSRSGGDAPGSQSGSAVPGADPWERGRALAGPGSDQGRTAPRPMLAPRSATRQGTRSPGAAPGAHTVRRDPRDVLVPAARRRRKEAGTAACPGASRRARGAVPEPAPFRIPSAPCRAWPPSASDRTTRSSRPPRGAPTRAPRSRATRAAA